MSSVYLGAACALLVVIGCNTSADDVSPQPDAAGDTTSAEAASDANACVKDSTEIICCCDGDVGGTVMCDANGSYSCGAGLSLYFGADCTRPCGPCSIACPDTGAGESGAD